MNTRLFSNSYFIYLLVCTAIALILTIVWINIEKVDIAYTVHELQGDMLKKEALIEKLRVEQDTFFSPLQLLALAKDFNLKPANPGQLRKIDIAENNILLKKHETNKIEKETLASKITKGALANNRQTLSYKEAVPTEEEFSALADNQ